MVSISYRRVLVLSGVQVHWIVGTGSRIFPSLASLEVGPGVSVWNELAIKLGVSCGEFRPGNWTREFRNKSFRDPLWLKPLTSDARFQAKCTDLWEPERNLVGVFEGRFEMALSDLEEECRSILVEARYSDLTRKVGAPLTGFQVQDGQVCAVYLGSGETIECQQVIYADRWSLLPLIEGIPKPIEFLRRRDPMGVLQASFNHSIPVGLGVQESFFALLHRSSGDKADRRVWGHFFAEGQRSVWTLCLSHEEVEDNHEIGKKLRRLKGTLDRIFEGSELLSGGKKKFEETVEQEQVRFEEEVIFAGGAPLLEPLTLPGLSGVF